MTDEQEFYEQQWDAWVNSVRAPLAVQLQGNAQLVEAAEDWHRILEMPEVPHSARVDARLNRDCIIVELGFRAPDA